MQTGERQLGPVTQIPPGEGRAFEISGQRIAVFRNRQGALFATHAECPHKGGPLADGLIGDTTLICPLHDWFFDLATGRLKNGECEIATYPVRASDDGQILVTLQSG
jgi:nitrite reductase (NADH) small subunit